MFICRPYLSIGSLRDQIIYPDTVEDMVKKNIKEEKLWEIMKMVSLEHIVARYFFQLAFDNVEFDAVFAYFF